MSPSGINPFVDDDRRALWEICVRRDIEAFMARDWSLCAADFQEKGFVGLDAQFAADPAGWRLTFPTLQSYRISWEQQSHDFAAEQFAVDPRAILYAAMRLDPIILEGDHALVYKKFNGELPTLTGKVIPLHWQSLFFAQRVAGQWKLRGFVGYLPFPWPAGMAR